MAVEDPMTRTTEGARMAAGDHMPLQIFSAAPSWRDTWDESGFRFPSLSVNRSQTTELASHDCMENSILVFQWGYKVRAELDVMIITTIEFNDIK